MQTTISRLLQLQIDTGRSWRIEIFLR